jgi:hypothetical protein
LAKRVKAQLLLRGAKTIEPEVLDRWEVVFNAFTPVASDPHLAVPSQGVGQ